MAGCIWPAWRRPVPFGCRRGGVLATCSYSSAGFERPSGSARAGGISAMRPMSTPCSAGCRWARSSALAPRSTSIADGGRGWPTIRISTAMRFPATRFMLRLGRCKLPAGRLACLGPGCFSRYDAGLRLSAPGRTRSVWTLPAWMLPARGPALSYHRDPSRWSEASLDRVALRTVAQGQEFVLDCAADLPALYSWLTTMLPHPSAISMGRDAPGLNCPMPQGVGRANPAPAFRPAR